MCVSVLAAAAAWPAIVAVVPNWKGCADNISQALPYCDTKLSHEQRLLALVSNLTLQEKIGMISPDPALGDPCMDHTSGKPSIGLPNYVWLIEVNSDVQTNCMGADRCATNFIGPMGMGSSFNRSSWRLKGDVLATEFRAFNNAGNNLVGLTGFGPNINIARDPRFGRTSELPGEDPFHSGTYGTEVTLGLQEEDAHGHPKILAYLKHFTAYSREENRLHDNHNISLFDYWDSYLAQYEIAFKGSNASGVMCSYTAENGHPSCANGYILNDVLREKWGQTNAVVTTDCTAVKNMLGAPVNANNITAAAWTIMNGTDLEMGSTLWRDHMKAAIDAGLATEEAVTRSATRALRQMFRAGRFDPPEQIGWSSIGPESVNSTRHQQIAEEAALQGMVLLKNSGGVLPLKLGSKIAVVGPMGMTTNLISDYNIDFCSGGGQSCVKTIAEALADENKGGTTTMAKGVDINSMNTTGIRAALELVRAADVAVLVLGNDKSQEHEGIDRPDINLPGQQESFARQVFALGKPTVLVLSNGGAVAIDNLVAPSHAIIEAFNPAKYSPALAKLVFGRENRWGKLPVTIYPHSFSKEQAMTDYDMTSAPGRTYRYYTGKPLFEFGHGLSYTTFVVACNRTSSSSSAALSFSCSVQNTGKLDGDEVVMAYHSAGAAIRAGRDHPVPLKSLIGFERVRVRAGQTEMLKFEFSDDALLLVNKTGEKVLYEGARTLIFSNGAGQANEFQVNVTAAGQVGRIQAAASSEMVV